jgi:hypothetical protein
MQWRLAMPVRAAAFALLLVVTGCGASEPSGPQLPCSEVHQKVRQMGQQLDRDGMGLSDMIAQMPMGQSAKRTEYCARAKVFVQQRNEVLKLIRDNKDRCKEFDFTPFGVGSISLESGTTVSGVDEFCK